MLIILSVMIAAPIQRNIIQMGMNIPDDFQYYSEEQQTQFMNAQANRTSPLVPVCISDVNRFGLVVDLMVSCSAA